MRYWFTQLPLTIVKTNNTLIKVTGLRIPGELKYGSTETASDALAALDSFGTNAIPFLMSKLTQEDSALERRAIALARKLGVKSNPFRNADLERYQTVTALVRIKKLPFETMRTLTNLSQVAAPKIALVAREILRQLNRPLPSPQPWQDIK